MSSWAMVWKINLLCEPGHYLDVWFLPQYWVHLAKLQETLSTFTLSYDTMSYETMCHMTYQYYIHIKFFVWKRLVRQPCTICSVRRRALRVQILIWFQHGRSQGGLSIVSGGMRQSLIPPLTIDILHGYAHGFQTFFALYKTPFSDF